MSRQNHEKRNRQRQVAKNYLYPISSQTFDSQTPATKWEPLRFGKHKGRTLIEIVDKDIAYIGWLIINDIVTQDLSTEHRIKLAHQIIYLANRLRCILPPAPCRDSKEFAIVVDVDNVFERFEVVQRDKPVNLKLAQGSRIAKRTKLLDVTIVYKYSNPDVGMKRMARCIEKTFFAVDVPNPVRKKEVFFENDCNFGMAKIRAFQKSINMEKKPA
jgi:hypothetical protein